MRNKISKTDIQIWLFFGGKNSNRWFTAEEIASAIKRDGRNVRLHLAYFVELGLLEKFSFSKAHRYRWSCKTIAAKQYEKRIGEAVKIFGGK